MDTIGTCGTQRGSWEWDGARTLGGAAVASAPTTVHAQGEGGGGAWGDKFSHEPCAPWHERIRSLPSPRTSRVKTEMHMEMQQGHRAGTLNLSVSHSLHALTRYRKKAVHM